MNQISPLAYVHPEASIGDNNIIGPFCYIDKTQSLETITFCRIVLQSTTEHASGTTMRFSQEQACPQNRKT